MNLAGYILGQTLLEQTQMRSGIMLSYQSLTLILLDVGEYLDITLGIFIAYVQPELIELVG